MEDKTRWKAIFVVALVVIGVGYFSYVVIRHQPGHPDFPEGVPPLKERPIVTWDTLLVGKNLQEAEAFFGGPPTKFMKRDEIEKALFPRKLDDEKDGKKIGSLARWVNGRDEVVVIFSKEERVMRGLGERPIDGFRHLFKRE
jgi:hypothetical protein